MTLWTKIIPVGLVAAFVLTQTSLSSPPNSRAISGAPTVVKVEMRDTVVTIKTTAAGPRYTVQKQTGELLANEVSMESLQASDPELSKLVKRAIAVNEIRGLLAM